MKYWVLVCEGMADDPIEELNQRTPLEAAKTPVMDELAKKGRIGSASFVPPAMEASGEAACLSILGLNPLEDYTGPAPLEALAAGIAQNDNQIAFRCDFVTVLDDALIDPTAGMISDRESAILMKGLSEKLSNAHFKFYPLGGYKNLLVVDDPEWAEAMDEMECLSPEMCLGRSVAKSLPRGRGNDMIRGLMEKSKSILENHDVNRVRIDLNENPASSIWLWGQGKRPKLSPFMGRCGLGGIVRSEEGAVRGLAKAMGLEAMSDYNFHAAQQKDFTFIYYSWNPAARYAKDLKSKIRFIEAFDSKIVAKALKAAEHFPEMRIAILSDTVESLEKKTKLSGAVPVLVYGKGIESQNAAGFNERMCSQSNWNIEEGYKWLDAFLKN